MDKFECKGCGACCSERSIDEAPEDMYPTFSKNSYVFYCCKPTLTLFDWEAKELAEAAEEKGIKVDIVPFRVVYDTAKNQTIVMQVHPEREEVPTAHRQQVLCLRQKATDVQTLSCPDRRRR